MGRVSPSGRHDPRPGAHEGRSSERPGHARELAAPTRSATSSDTTKDAQIQHSVSWHARAESECSSPDPGAPQGNFVATNIKNDTDAEIGTDAKVFPFPAVGGGWAVGYLWARVADTPSPNTLICGNSWDSNVHRSRVPMTARSPCEETNSLQIPHTSHSPRREEHRRRIAAGQGMGVKQRGRRLPSAWPQVRVLPGAQTNALLYARRARRFRWSRAAAAPACHSRCAPAGSNHGRGAAVHVDRRAGGEACVIRAQEAGHGGELLGLAHAADRDTGAGLGDIVLE